MVSRHRLHRPHRSTRPLSTWLATPRPPAMPPRPSWSMASPRQHAALQEPESRVSDEGANLLKGKRSE